MFYRELIGVLYTFQTGVEPISKVFQTKLKGAYIAASIWDLFFCLISLNQHYGEGKGVNNTKSLIT